MIVCASEISPPPPSPCTSRAAIKRNMVGASAQASEPTMKVTIPMRSVIRRPWLSLNLP
jgi:hypothetical protein